MKCFDVQNLTKSTPKKVLQDERTMSIYPATYNFIIFLLLVVMHIYPPITGQCQTLTIGRSAQFSL